MNTAVNQSKSSPSCIYCGEGTRHQLLECRKFAGLNGVEKLAICKKKGLCFGCMKQSHMKMNCPSPLKCSKCKRAHPTPLHDPNREKKAPEDNKPSETLSVMTGCVGTFEEGSGPLMTIVPILVKVKNSDQCVATYAFLDNGCGAVFVNKELSDTLHVRTRATRLILFLRTINLEETVDTETTLDQLQIGNIDSTTFHRYTRCVYQRCTS